LAASLFMPAKKPQPELVAKIPIKANVAKSFLFIITFLYQLHISYYTTKEELTPVSSPF
jgi:hypothetical protein